MEKENYDDLIGTEVEVIDNKSKKHKKVTIKSYKYTDDTTVFLTTDNEMYTEDELNLVYILSESTVLRIWLEEHAYAILGIIAGDVKANGLCMSFIESMILYRLIIKNDKKPLPKSISKIGDPLIEEWINENKDVIRDELMNILADHNYFSDNYNQLFESLRKKIENILIKKQSS